MYTHDMNKIILNRIADQTVTYKSTDFVMNKSGVVNFLTELLNSLNVSGLPSHIQNLKIGVPIILLQNFNQPKYYNGTWLIVKRFMNNLIKATIMIGSHKDEDILLPRIPISAWNSVKVQITSNSNTTCVHYDYQ